MNKILIAPIFVALIWLPSLVYAEDTCESLFSDANTVNAQSRQYAALADSNFTEMKKQAQLNASNKTMCDLGRTSRMGAMQSARGFRMARASWLKAINVCGSPNDKNASVEADKNTSAYNTQANFIASMDNLLKTQCGFEPLTPLLNTIDTK